MLKLDSFQNSTHGWDGIERLEHSNYKSWNDGGSEPAGDLLEHCYAGSRHIQNYDGSNYGARWHCVGRRQAAAATMSSPVDEARAGRSRPAPTVC